MFVPDSVEAADWLDRAVRQGVVAAQYELGMLLLSDDLEIRDPGLGVQWLEYVAHNKSDHAVYQLGKEYFKGKDVRRNAAKAFEQARYRFMKSAAKATNMHSSFWTAGTI